MQYDIPVIDPLITTGTQLADYLNNWAQAVETTHAGAGRPPYVQPGTLWLHQISASNWVLKLATAGGDVAVANVNPATGLATDPSAGAAGGSATLGPDGKLTPAQLPASVTGRNVIIGGDFSTNPWQRGFTFANAGAGFNYTADRWGFYRVGTSSYTVARDNDVPSTVAAGQPIIRSALMDCTTAQTPMTANDFVLFMQAIEGYNILPYLGTKPCTLSFWVKATKPGIYCVALRGGAPTWSCVLEYTVTAANSWEKKVLTFPVAPLGTPTWNVEAGVGMYLSFALALGATYYTPFANAGAWFAGNVYGTDRQVNAADSAANDFRLAAIQLEAGSAATPFEPRTVQAELMLCQRYFSKSYDVATAPATVTLLGSHQQRYTLGGAVELVTIPFPVRMRVAPSMTFRGTSADQSVGFWFDSSAALARAVAHATGSPSESRFSVTVGAATAGNVLLGHWTADAEM